MIYVRTDEKDLVKFIHHMPFDEKHGLNKTHEELEKEGVLFDRLPDSPDVPFGKQAILYVNPLRWELEDRPLTQEEKLQQMVDDGILTQEQMDDLIQ